MYVGQGDLTCGLLIQSTPHAFPLSFTSWIPTPTTRLSHKSSGRYECADAPSSSTAPFSGMCLLLLARHLFYR